jgi:hypothetical protein
LTGRIAEEQPDQPGERRVPLEADLGSDLEGLPFEPRMPDTFRQVLDPIVGLRDALIAPFGIPDRQDVAIPTLDYPDATLVVDDGIPESGIPSDRPLDP